MKTLVLSNSTEYSFWGNVEYFSNLIAKKERDKKYRELKKNHPGEYVTRSILYGQLRPYSGLGQPDGRIGNVYIVRVYKPLDK